MDQWKLVIGKIHFLESPSQLNLTQVFKHLTFCFQRLKLLNGLHKKNIVLHLKTKGTKNGVLSTQLLAPEC
jgi:hypothetical protein